MSTDELKTRSVRFQQASLRNIALLEFPEALEVVDAKSCSKILVSRVILHREVQAASKNLCKTHNIKQSTENLSAWPISLELKATLAPKYLQQWNVMFL